MMQPWLLRLLAPLWLLFITVLFLLPGKALPQSTWLDAVYADKWVHAGFFALLVFFWRSFFLPVPVFQPLLFFIALGYGLGIELIQHYLIVNRAFDVGDLLADAIGILMGFWMWKGIQKK